MNTPPQDLRPGWLNIARRMQASMSGNRGAAIAIMRVVVDESGDPVMWVAPDLILLEPRSRSAAIRDFIDGLAGLTGNK